MKSAKYARQGVLSLLTGAALLISLSPAWADNDNAEPRKVLKVCADPNYQPFSTRDLSGYENRLAELVGSKLGIPVEYTWFPQRMGFIRNTLRKKNPDGDGYLCDLVIGVPKQFELGMASDPYMHSTYAMVVARDGRLGQLEEAAALAGMDAETRKSVKVGVTESSPGAMWLARHDLFDQLAPYVAQSADPEEYPGQLQLQDLLAGKLDAAIVWGPVAANFVRQGKDRLRMLPMKTEPGVPLDYEISMAVRFGEDDWKTQINQLLSENAGQVKAILEEYGIPLLPVGG
ncbi:MAG: quinoprotein dehydrogenase-associated putative ABC transporter substrate-binding protein [Thiothrix sp.]|nr:quinoprotein dehydrogenase-associated putative ABC transporter substrate-binding protein [Thiothrix sp.]HPQ96671.1 quinoprotein dehydrogenase-associated putative ABC transporter substrate-binding protein [Thiolinea sp.]